MFGSPERIATDIGDGHRVIPSSTSTSPRKSSPPCPLDTGVRGGPGPEDVIREAFGREIAEA